MFPQCFWNWWESGGSRSGHTAPHTRPAALLCKWLLSLKHIPQTLFYRNRLVCQCLFLLCCQDCYIADQSGSSVMVWKGKQASKEERREALNRAMVSSMNDAIYRVWDLYITNKRSSLRSKNGFKSHPLSLSTRVTSKPRTTPPAPLWRWWRREESRHCSSTCSNPGLIRDKLRVWVPPTVWGG